MTNRLIDAESHPHDELPGPFRCAVEEILAEPVPEVNLARIASRLPGPSAPQPAGRSWPVRIRHLAWTVAAAAVVVVVASRWMQPSSAPAQAIRQVREARSLSYTELLTVKGQEQPVKVKVFIAEDGRKRSEIPGLGKSGGVTTIFDASGEMRVTLLEDIKRAIVQDRAKAEPRENPGMGLLAWLQALKELGDKPDKELGQKVLEGKRVTGFAATQGNFKFTMWVESTTGKPVHIEYESPVNGAGYQAVAMTDFRFDEKLDESLFSFDVPAGYKVQQQPAVPTVPGGEESVIEALRGYTKRDGGKFPPSLADWGPWIVLFSEGSQDGTIDPELTRVAAHLGAITPFLVSMPKDEYAYLGEGKTVKQKDAIVFWYKKPNGTYRAIYGDLSARDIEGEDLPKK